MEQNYKREFLQFPDDFQYDVNEYIKKNYFENFDFNRILTSSFLLGAEVGAIVTKNNYAKINTLFKYDLLEPIHVNVENEDGIVTVSIPDPPLYGNGNDIHEALGMLKNEIEDIYEELNEDDNFSDIWLKRRKYLNSIIIQKA